MLVLFLLSKLFSQTNSYHPALLHHSCSVQYTSAIGSKESYYKTTANTREQYTSHGKHHYFDSLKEMPTIQDGNHGSDFTTCVPSIIRL